ncbi:MAG: hypothetical protein ACRDOH_31315, partial [Streptosporangiaceae bacterium]
SKPWLHSLGEPDLIALSAVTRVPAATLAGMTLARYQGTGLAEVTAEPGRPWTPRCAAAAAPNCADSAGRSPTWTAASSP